MNTPSLPAEGPNTVNRDMPTTRTKPAAVRPLAWFALLAWSLFLAASLALAINAVLFGRTPLGTLVPRLVASATLTPALIATACWWLAYCGMLGRGKARRGIVSVVVPSLPLLLTTTMPMLGIYTSDALNHYFYYSFVNLNQAKGLALLLIAVAAAVFIQAAYLGSGFGTPWRMSLEKAAARTSQPLTLVLLAVIGVLQGSAYQTEFLVDFVRYWSIADAMTLHVPYPSIPTGASYAAGGMSQNLIDLPLYPALLAASFHVFGHSTVAPYLVVIASSAALPPLLYLLFRELIRHRATALSLTCLVALFPLLRLHALNMALPDPVFFAVLICCSWLFVRIVKGDTRFSIWLLFGLSTGATALTRPEGLAYALSYAVVALFAPSARLPKLLGTALFVASVAGFVLVMMSTFGIPWPQNWTGTVRLENIPLNVPVLISDDFFNSAIRLSPLQLAIGWGTLLLLAAVGSTPFVYRPWFAAALIAPAWVNLLAVYMVDPRVSGASLWFDFFRHVSYVIPFLALAAGKVLDVAAAIPRSPRLRTLTLTALNVLLFAGVMWNVHSLSKPSWSFGPDAVNLIDAGRINLIDIVMNPIQLPLLGYSASNGYSRPVFPVGFIESYPEQINNFYRQFDAVKQMSGTSYVTGSLLIYLAALVLALLPCPPSQEPEDSSR